MSKRISFALVSILFFSFFALTSCRPSGGHSVGKGHPAEYDEDESEEQSDDSLSLKMSKPVGPMTLKVYVENSGSMQGYIAAPEFYDAVHAFITDIYVAKMADTTEFYFINDKILPQGGDLDSYFAQFKLANFNYGSSDISKMLKMILDKNDGNTVSVLVSDCIFSPGKGVDAADYLNRERDGIKTLWADKSNKVNGMAAAVFRKSAMFKGKFFNKLNKPIKINEERPYFIWVMGPVGALAMLREKVPDERLNADHSFTIIPQLRVNYNIIPRSGTFAIDGPHTIKNFALNSKTPYPGEFSLAIGADMTGLQALLGKDYIADSRNYTVEAEKLHGGKCLLEVKPPREDSRYSHFLWLTSEKLFSGEVRITLNEVMPEWIEKVSEDDGLTAVPDKTFGFSTLVNGIYDASLKRGKYTEFDIKVKGNK
jgi:hypothetical protein